MTTYFSITPTPLAARVLQASNLSGTYNNGNSGTGATLTANSNGALTVDSVAVAVGDIVLLINQSTAYQNGPYIVTAAGDGSHPYILTRSGLFTASPSLAVGGTFIPIGAGTVHAGQIWVLVEPLPVNIGTDSITFVQT